MATRLQRVEKPLRDLRKSLKNLSKDPRPDEVHNLRTRARRVEAIAAAWTLGDEKLARRLVRSIKPLRKAAGAVRDIDVLTANVLNLPRGSDSVSLVRLVENLGSARRAHANTLLRAARRRRKEACQNLAEYSKLVQRACTRTQATSAVGASASLAEGALRPKAARLARKLSRWPALDEHNLHLFRIRVKELRSILQLFADCDADLVKVLGEANARIGDWHDWQQLKEIAENIPGEPLARALLGRIARTTGNKLRQALAAADALRTTHLQAASERAWLPGLTSRRRNGRGAAEAD